MAYDILTYVGTLIISLIETTGYFGVFILMTLESAAVLVPSEVTMPFAGFASSTGFLNFWAAIAAGTAGNLTGSLILYFVGFYGGRPLAEKYGSFIGINKKELEWADKFFLNHGEKTVFFGRLLPVARTYISFPAGLARMSFNRFVFYTTAGSFLWSWFLVYIGWKLGENWQTVEIYFRQADIVIAGVIVATVVWFVWKHRGR